MTTAKKKKSSESVSFEQSYAELEKIVDRFDHGDLTLDEAVASFERGLALAEQLKARLATVENKVKILRAQKKNMADSSLETKIEGEEWTSSDS